MLKNISNLGTPLKKEQQKSIRGGIVPGTAWDEQYCMLPENYYNCTDTGGGDGGTGGGD